MQPGRIEGATRNLGAPADWRKDVLGPCGSLTIRDALVEGCHSMTSVWQPTPEELMRLNAGASVHLTVFGYVHPAVALSVGLAPVEYPYGPETCPGHTASEVDTKRCCLCGVHIDELRSDGDED